MKIRRLLVANRGGVARRIIRTAHRMGIATVAVFSQPDAQALHVREAGRACALGGQTFEESYLRIDMLVAAARATGADAVHPGCGLLSESAEFAQAVEDAGLIWIGPSPEAMRTLGNKARVKALAEARGIPCLPGYAGSDQSETRLLAEAEAIGFPLVVKAAAGGGGRALRLVTAPDQLQAALRSVRWEARASFGSGELLLEQALLRTRHVEVQVFCDMHGKGVHLGERDGSVQRHHQKIIGEAPGPGLDMPLRERMGQCAVELAQAAGYAGAGTVEFLLEDGGFYLMEMNTGLQPEQPVTEAVTGFDLVEWQIRIARGEPLPRRQKEVRLHGHAIGVQLCAEDESFTPRSGTIRRFVAPPLGEAGGAAGEHGAVLRFDHALEPGVVVTPQDGRLGTLVSHAGTREAAIAQLLEALEELQVLGLPTNRRLLAACLRHPAFAAGAAPVTFLAEQGDAIRADLLQEEWSVTAEAAFAAILPAGGSSALPSPFTRPLRMRHRDHVLEVPLCEADGVAASEAAVVPLARGRWHVQFGSVDLFLSDASFEPPGAMGDDHPPGVDE